VRVLEGMGSTMGADERLPVLLVDDDPLDARLAVYWLRQSRCVGDVHVVHDGEQALAYLREQQRLPPEARPRCMLLDLNLPRLSGFQVLAALRADPGLADFPVIVLSGAGFAEDRRHAQQLRAGLFLVKPADADEFAAMIRAVDEFCEALPG